MGPEGIILVNSPITSFQQSLTHSALVGGEFPIQSLGNVPDGSSKVKIVIERLGTWVTYRSDSP